MLIGDLIDHESMDPLVIPSIDISLLRRFHRHRLLLCVPHPSFCRRTRIVRVIWWLVDLLRWSTLKARSILRRRSIGRRRRGIVRSSVNSGTTERSAVTSAVAGPVPPRQAVVVGIVEAGTSFCGTLSLFLISVVADGNNETDLDDENDDNDYNNGRVVVRCVVVAVVATCKFGADHLGVRSWSVEIDVEKIIKTASVVIICPSCPSQRLAFESLLARLCLIR